MSEKKLWYLISYDVRDQKRLRHTAKHLEGYGTRLQYSVFRCRLTMRQLERLQWELTCILKPEDSLITVGLCETCIKRIRKKNSDCDWPETIASYEII
ncbi:MAG: CRISPR-associated endonuclease Cas2 [Planctomycetota bacterium]